MLVVLVVHFDSINNIDIRFEHLNRDDIYVESKLLLKIVIYVCQKHFVVVVNCYVLFSYRHYI